MTVRKTKNNRWQFLAMYVDDEGRRRQKSGTFDTRKEAKEAEALFLHERDNTLTRNATFSMLYKDFLQDRQGKIKDSSVVSINSKVTKHILPYFSRKLISDITINDVRLWQNKLRSQGYSHRYLTSIHTRLSTILEFGVKYYGLANNVARAQGNFPLNSTISKPQMVFWTYEEWKAFEAVLPDDEFKAFFQFLYWTGCRRGEAQALTWHDFDKGFNHVTISKTCSQKVTGQGYQITPPKTQSSNRVITIPNALKSVLQAKYEHDKCIVDFSNDWFVFGCIKPLADNTIRLRKDRGCKDANVQQIRVHDFRHSHASFLFSHGVDVAVVSKRLGHDNVATTMKVYIHMLPNQEDKALALLNKFE